MIKGSYPGLFLPMASQLSLINGWVEFNAASKPVAFLSGKVMVTFKGRLKAGTLADNTKIGTLTEEFRPLIQVNMAATGRATTGQTLNWRFQVAPNGDMFIFGLTGALGALLLDYISLDGLNYMVI